METNNRIIDELAQNNQCIKFIVDNYGMLCRAHPGKTVLVIDDDYYVSRTFDSSVEAVMYIHAIGLQDLPFAIAVCNGSDLFNNNLMYSDSCKSLS